MNERFDICKWPVQFIWWWLANEKNGNYAHNVSQNAEIVSSTMWHLSQVNIIRQMYRLMQIEQF